MAAESIEYVVHGQKFVGRLSLPASEGKYPGVIVVHEWWGRSAHVENVADRLADLGFAALALDMYGEGKLTQNPDEANDWMTNLFSGGEVQARFDAAIDLLKSHPAVDSSKVACIGYCMGGSICLEMARTGRDLSAAISFHAGLQSQLPVEGRPGPMCPVLACHGDADPFVGRDQVEAFVEEMNSYPADWQLLIFGGVKHAFTNPAADSAGLDALKYDAKADARSWSAMTHLLREAFGE